MTEVKSKMLSPLEMGKVSEAVRAIGLSLQSLDLDGYISTMGIISAGLSQLKKGPEHQKMFDVMMRVKKLTQDLVLAKEDYQELLKHEV